MKYWKRIFAAVLSVLLIAAVFSGCQTGTAKQVVIYSNCDEEAKLAMEKVLNENGYEGKYLFQSFGTSDLGGKLVAEGKNIEADLLTMSTYYLQSVQEQHQMFQKLSFQTPEALTQTPDYYASVLGNEGAIFVNTELMKANNLPIPASLKDLANPIYKDQISVIDVKSSSTAWLMVQALVTAYGEDGAKEVLKGIYSNAGAQIESSGSGPIKKVRAGEAAIGFGLRHQAVADKEKGLPIDYIDPTEGNFQLQEALAVIDKGENSNPLAMEMAKCIMDKVRPEMQKTYPIALYQGESTSAANQSKYPKTFAQPLTVELLKQHQDLSESCKS